MKHYLVILLTISSYSLQCQNFSRILNDSYSKFVIFDSTYQQNFLLTKIDFKFNPSDQEIVTANNLLNIFDIKNRHSKKKKRRQVIGYVKKGVKYLILNELEFRNNNQFIKDYSEWETDFIVKLKENIKYNQLYIVNLEDNTVGFFNLN